MNHRSDHTHIMNRNDQLARLSNTSEVWDFLVIGGGATGLGIALDAATRGYKTLLVEAADFAKGTSSRSTKLVHGGVRYLAQGDVRLVREASIERGLLCRNAPHLVRNQTFIIPLYSNWDRLKYGLGLKVYDWIAGKLSLGSSVLIPRQKTIEALPGIDTRGLLGGVAYHDGQFDDARLALNLAQTIVEQGGCAINYAKVSGLTKTEGKLTGAIVEDGETGRRYNIKAKAVVNATGVFVDAVLAMDNAAARKTICVSQGIHLVLDKKFFPSNHALMIPETSDGRVLFAVPWHDKVVVGTTDTPVDEASLEPRALEKEIRFVLETASAYLTQKPTRADVLSVFAGLRPLAAPKDEQEKTKEISRSHKIIVSPSNLFTILGGKWTTFRKMGEDMVSYVERHLQWTPKKSGTAHLKIHGYQTPTDWNDPFYFYGSDAAPMQRSMNGNAEGWISEALRIHAVQVEWAVKHEMARTVEDVLSRRTRALLLDARESMRISREVANIMALALHKDEQWVEEQVAAFNTLAQTYILTERTPSLLAV